MEDRPSRIKVEVLPYDGIDIDAALNDLQSAGLIIRYNAEGMALIQVTTFSRHQRITGKEAETPSRFPGVSQKRSGKQRENIGETLGKQPRSLEGKGREGNEEGKGREGNIPQPAKPADRPNEAESIYQLYPKRVGKADALKAIAKALAMMPADQLRAKVAAYAAATATWTEHDRQYIPHPSTWFNRGSYDDDPATWARTLNGANRHQLPEATAEDHAKGFYHGLDDEPAQTRPTYAHAP